MKRLAYSTIFLSLVFFISCSDEEETKASDLKCVEYDVRQCGQDIFADEISPSISNPEMTTNMKTWLEDQGVDVRSVTINPNAYEGVCEACGICPEQWTFIAEVTESSVGLFEDFQLLNYKVEDCL